MGGIFMFYFFKKSAYLTMAILFVTAIFSIVGCQVSSSSNQPEIALKNYLDSAKELDVEKAADFVIDRRYSNREEQLESYEQSLQYLKLLNYKIKDIRFEDEKVYIDATLIIDQLGRIKEEEHTFRLISDDGQWKVVFPLEEELEAIFQSEQRIQLIEPKDNTDSSPH